MKSPSFSFVSASKRFTSKFYLWNTNLTIMRFVVLQSEEVYKQTVSDSFVANMYFQIDCDLDLVLGRSGKMTTTLYRDREIHWSVKNLQSTRLAESWTLQIFIEEGFSCPSTKWCLITFLLPLLNLCKKTKFFYQKIASKCFLIRKW